MSVIELAGVHKHFGSTHALDAFDLNVELGEVHGFLGPNGAGKSTAIRIILGLQKHDGGTVALFGQDPWKHAAELHKRLAYVPGDVNLWPNLTGGETIDLLGRLRGGLNKQRRNELIDLFELDPTKKGRAYSKGNRQKVALIAAFASDVELLLLDEPTSGLDPLMSAHFRAQVDAFKDAGHSVLLSSHVLAEVEALCDQITIIRSGRTVESGSLGELRHLTRTAVHAETRTKPHGLESLPGIHDLHIEGHRIRFDVDSDQLGPTIERLAMFGIVTLSSAPPSLEELFLGHYDLAEEAI